MENSQKGFIPVMLTPFSNDGRIDFDALKQLTQTYLRAGAAGLFANCLSSEMFELSDEERINLIRNVVEITDKSVPVIATGTFGGPISKQADFVKRVYDEGVDAVIVITSLLGDETDGDEAFNQQVSDLLDQTSGIPLGFYECPVPYKRVLKPVQLAEFVSTGRVIYHKDTSLDLEQVKEKLRLTQGHHFGLYDAYMVHAVDSLKAGSSGLSCIQGNYFPELIVWLCKHYNDSNLSEEVAKVQQFLIDHMDVMHNVYPIASKYFLQKRGMNISTFTRRLVGTMTVNNVSEIDDLFVNYNVLKSELELK